MESSTVLVTVWSDEADNLTPTAAVMENWQTNQSSLDPFWDQIPWAHEYWKQFNMSTIPASYHYAVATWMTFFGILGTFGNLIVIWTFLRRTTLRTPSNFLVVNLAFSDMMFSAVNGFPLLTLSSINGVWRWGQTWCRLYGWAGGFFGFISISSLAFVAEERYEVITKPLEAATRMTKKRAMANIAIVWLWSALWATPPLLGWGNYIPEGFQTDCTFDYLSKDISNVTMVFSMYVFGFVAPVSVILYSYYKIVSSMFRHAKMMANTADRMGATMTKQDQAMKTEYKTAKVAMISISAFILSWTPYAIVALIGISSPLEDKRVTPVMAMIPVMMAKASAAYNPLIYTFSHPKFRMALQEQFPWLMCWCKAPQAGPGVSTSMSSVRHGRNDTTRRDENAGAHKMRRGASRQTSTDITDIKELELETVAQ